MSLSEPSRATANYSDYILMSLTETYFDVEGFLKAHDHELAERRDHRCENTDDHRMNLNWSLKVRDVDIS